MRTLWLLLLLVPLTACGGPPNPLAELRTTYAAFPEYTVILEDMRNVGTFGNDFQHRYRVIATEEVAGDAEPRLIEQVTDWRPVSSRLYRQYEDLLGMAVLSKKDGVVSEDAFPPAFAYVGDPRYGQWQTDAGGNQFWTFFAAYTMLDMMGDAFEGRRIRRSYYEDYRRARGTGAPYTAGGMFGTGGTATRTTNPTFFERQAARQRAGATSFGNRVNDRVNSGRTPRSTGSSFRGVGGGFGK